jgi:pimeloyl-ACP methyl ester carboxylesterase
MRRLHGLIALAHDAVDGVTHLVEDGHASVGRAVRRVAAVTPLAEPVAQVEELRAGVTSGVLGAVRAVNGAVRAVTEAVVPARGEAAAVPLRSDAVGGAPWLADAAQGLVNGAVGDHLRARGNGLDLELRLRVGDVVLPGEPDALRAAAAALPAPERVVVLVHGLMTTEWSWWLDAERLHGDPADGLARRLTEAGFTPVFVRYNTGVSVEDNGRRLAEQLGALLEAWPTGDVVLVGHSMGGLVVRSAVHLGPAWRRRVRRAVCLGSPHAGAPLARFGAVAAATMLAVDLPATRVIGAILARRSAGIQDLQRGTVGEAGLVDGVAWTFLSGGLSSKPDGALTRALGDILVPVASAAGGALRPELHRHLPGVPHHALQAHPDAVAAVLEALAPG